MYIYIYIYRFAIRIAIWLVQCWMLCVVVAMDQPRGRVPLADAWQNIHCAMPVATLVEALKRSLVEATCMSALLPNAWRQGYTRQGVWWWRQWWRWWRWWLCSRGAHRVTSHWQWIHVRL